MVRILLKKQMQEFLRALFHDGKKHKRRSTVSIIGYFLLYGLLEVTMLGMFGALAYMMYTSLKPLGLTWFYFSAMSLVAVSFGTLGSLFNSYSALYLAKDNDALLSMPIPPATIIFSRLFGVYLLGLFYSATILLPTIVVYLYFESISFTALLGSIVLLGDVSLIVLVLSALLGWIVAQISVKVKHKNIVLTVLQLAFLSAYMLVYTNLQNILSAFVAKAVMFGVIVKDSAYPLYLFGTIGNGSLTAMMICTAVILLVTGFVYMILSRSFLQDVTATGKTERKQYKEKKLHRNSPFMALLQKEGRRFFSSPAYMLNCGLGSFGMIVGFVFILVKQNDIVDLCSQLQMFDIASPELIAAALIACMTCMNDSAAPSISLEGKNMWILQTIPVKVKDILHAKISFQVLITVPFSLLCSIAMLLILPEHTVQSLFVIFLPVLFAILFSLFGLTMGLLMPNLEWTSEIVPIKQSMSVVIALFGNMIYVMAACGCYIWFGYRMGPLMYLSAVSAITIVLSATLYFWIMKYGTVRFSHL
ncbi:MAG: hypothetical protein ACI32N_06810 [Bulleidia sp.]